MCVLILNQTETFQYTHYSSCHPQGVKKGFTKGEALRLLRTNSSKIFEEKITNFKAHLLQRGHPEDLINTTLSEVNFKDRKLTLQQKPKKNLRILPFVTQYQPSVPYLKQILMKNWHLIEQQPLLSEIYKLRHRPSYLTKEGRRSKTYSLEPNYKKGYFNTRWGVVQACQPHFALIVNTRQAPSSAVPYHVEDRVNYIEQNTVQCRKINFYLKIHDIWPPKPGNQ